MVLRRLERRVELQLLHFRHQRPCYPDCSRVNANIVSQRPAPHLHDLANQAFRWQRSTEALEGRLDAQQRARSGC
jgi:hypothetical protein